MKAIKFLYKDVKGQIYTKRGIGFQKLESPEGCGRVVPNRQSCLIYSVAQKSLDNEENNLVEFGF